MIIIHSMFYYFIYHPLLQNFLIDAKNDNLQTAAKKLLHRVNLQVEYKGSIPQQGPTLIISNHPTSFDLFSFSSLLKRKDSFVIAAIVNDALGPEFIKIRLPIYLRKPFSLQQNLLNIRNFLIMHKEKYINQEEAKKRNHASINKASKLIDQGHLIAIFPTGGDFITKKRWKNGVGFLVDQITNPDTKIVFANIKNIKKRDQIRLFIPINKKIFKLKKILIEFSKPIPITDFTMEKIHPKKLTKKLKKAYFNFYHHSD